MNTGLGALLAIACIAPALADDTEIFAVQRTQSRPNILMIFDTSGSMSTQVPSTGAYDPARIYEGSCQRDRVYWRRDVGTDPTCIDVGDNWFPAAQLRCDAAVRALDSLGSFQSGASGQWNPTLLRWVGLAPEVKDQPVECLEDAGVHGETAADSRLYAANGVQWTASEQERFNFDQDGTDRPFLFYSGNWVNWNTTARGTTTRTRMQIVQEAANTLVRSLSGVNVGLMRYSSNGGDGDAEAEGGMVIHAVSPVESARSTLLASIGALNTSGPTPLSETLFEAHQYFAGGAVVYGRDSRTGSGTGGAMPSVAESRVQPEGNLYRSPADTSCQKNYIIYLTDGLPNSDRNGENRIETLLGRQCDGSGEGLCLDDLAEYMNRSDLRATLGGDQTVTTYTVGFGPEVAGSVLLADTARRGGGEMFAANDVPSLVNTFNSIVEKIKQSARTFTAPAVAVNSFNRLETLTGLYVSVFEPAAEFHWPGNLKKYRLLGEAIGDAEGDPAVGTDGQFRDDAHSIWSPTTDGPNVRLGGAASRIPPPEDRKLFTLTGADRSLTANSNRIAPDNSLLDPLLGLGQPGDPTRQELVNWALGADVRNADGDPLTTLRREMGDPLHGRPAVVIYRGTTANPDEEAVVFVPTNDGYLHAIDAADGIEEWAFIPPELLNRLPALYRNDPAASKHYGLDGDIRVLKIDTDRDGNVDEADGDRVYLFFGMRRGGSNYYALDVTSKNSPKHLWTLGPQQLPGLGQTWSTPTVTRVDVSGATQNPQKLALVLGGGYDSTQDNSSTTSLYNADAVGNRIFIVDALSGNLLWTGGGDGVRADERDLSLPKMTNSIPAPVRVIDFEGDGFGDRLYAADTGGRIWRFDLFRKDPAGTGAPARAKLVTGGVFASLGNADESTHPVASTRRFYHAPDVAVISRRNSPTFLSISIGSGWRGHPLDERIEDRFYALRDYDPFFKLTQQDYSALDPITDSELTDITDIDTRNVQVSDTSPGWRLELRLPGGFQGEKVLAESRTFDNIVFFPTFLPRSGSGCGPLGGNRVYAVNVSDGKPVADINRDGRTSSTDRYTELAQGGIAPEVSFYFLPQELRGDTGGGGGGQPGESRGPVLCAVGLEILPSLCRAPGTAVRTYWRPTPP